MTFEGWLTLGIDMGWCSKPVCGSHDALPTTTEEDTAFEEGWDPCVPAVRLWLDQPRHTPMSN